MVYSIPVLQNPCGVTMSPAKRATLADLANAHNFVVAADEAYQLLSFPRSPAPPPPLRSFDKGDRVLSLGTFSKITGPGLRLGWLQASPWVHDKLHSNGQFRSGGALNPLVAGIMQRAMQSRAQDAHLALCRQTLQSRADRLSAAIRTHLCVPEVGCTFSAPSGGYFAWVQLPPGVDSGRVHAVASSKHRVSFLPGSRAGAAPELRRWMRLSFSFYDQSDLEEGVVRLRGAILDSAASC
jgi:2-aminoadipate transaminase